MVCDLRQLAHGEINRHGPLIVMPIVGRFRVHAEGSMSLCRVGNERLQKSGTDKIAMTMPGIAPDVIPQ